MQDFDLYRLILEEYRFQVQLNWDRTKFFLTLNLTLIATTATLLKLDRISALSSLLLFSLGVFVAIAGNQSLIKGHLYNRELLEDWLKNRSDKAQHQLAIATWIRRNQP